MVSKITKLAGAAILTIIPLTQGCSAKGETPPAKNQATESDNALTSPVSKPIPNTPTQVGTYEDLLKDTNEFDNWCYGAREVHIINKSATDEDIRNMVGVSTTDMRAGDPLTYYELKGVFLYPQLPNLEHYIPEDPSDPTETTAYIESARFAAVELSPDYIAYPVLDFHPDINIPYPLKWERNKIVLLEDRNNNDEIDPEDKTVTIPLGFTTGNGGFNVYNGKPKITTETIAEPLKTSP